MLGPGLARHDSKNDCMIEPVQQYNSQHHLSFYGVDFWTLIGLNSENFKW